MNVVIAAGGTGGHLYPAVALAKEFLQHDPQTSVTFVGAGRGLEDAMLAHEGFHLETIKTSGVIGRGVWASAQALSLLPRAIWNSIRLLKARCADLVIGTGGYTSPPIMLAAFFLGIRRVLLEPNAIPGVANRVFGPVVDRVFLAFEAAKDYFNPAKVRVIGTPVRQEFLTPGPPPPPVQLRHILIFGGSQGARAINSAVVEALKASRFLREETTLTHQTGQDDLQRITAAYASIGLKAHVVPFVFDMPRVLRSSDLVISRSGAMTLAELAACGKPAILIPLPHATHNHQEKNARAMESAEAAIVLLQSELTGEKLAQEIETLAKDPKRLRTMSEQSLALRRTDAAERMVSECLALLKK